MNGQIQFYMNRAAKAQITELLVRCDADFVPQLSSRVAIPGYAEKITMNAARFEAWADDTLCGLVAAYCNDVERGSAYVTSVSVLHEYQGKGIAWLNLLNTQKILASK
jgi:GNAT superfamily N-acetyltransferase